MSARPLSPALPGPVIGPEAEALMRLPVSIIVGSRDAALRPHLVRALGSRWDVASGRITVLLAAPSSARVLTDLAQHGQIAVVYSQPSTHRTVQFKGRDAARTPLWPGDMQLVARHADGFVGELALLGFGEAMARALLDCAEGDLVAVSFTASAAYEQTPGPDAGAALAGADEPAAVSASNPAVGSVRSSSPGASSSSASASVSASAPDSTSTPSPHPTVEIHASDLRPGAASFVAPGPPGASVDAVRACLEGVVPGVVATCDAEGVPNVTYVSQVEYVDTGHFALSFQFFNKTRRNVLANPQVELLLVHPHTAAMTRIAARYLRTERDGPLFERMKAKLAGIASHTGMSGVFRLLGADVYRAVEVDAVPGRQLAPAPAGPSRLAALRRALASLAGCSGYEVLVDGALAALTREFGISHALLLMHDEAGGRLYAVASRGYGTSGAGAEIALGDGVIGVAARERTPVRINHLSSEYAYGRAVRERYLRQGGSVEPEREIAWPGLAEPRSQLAVPLVSAGALLGVLFVESPEDLRFDWDDEDALVAFAAHLGAALRAEQARPEEAAEPAASEAMEGGAAPRPLPPDGGEALRVRYYDSDGSLFLGDDYLIKGVAGAVLWKLLREHAAHGRTEFSNRELRLAPEIRLPNGADNLEARLLMLTRRLAERCRCLRLERCGRGRLRLAVLRPLQLVLIGRDGRSTTP